MWSMFYLLGHGIFLQIQMQYTVIQQIAVVFGINSAEHCRGKIVRGEAEHYFLPVQCNPKHHSHLPYYKLIRQTIATENSKITSAKG